MAGSSVAARRYVARAGCGAVGSVLLVGVGEVHDRRGGRRGVLDERDARRAQPRHGAHTVEDALRREALDQCADQVVALGEEATLDRRHARDARVELEEVLHGTSREDRPDTRDARHAARGGGRVGGVLRGPMPRRITTHHLADTSNEQSGYSLYSTRLYSLLASGNRPYQVKDLILSIHSRFSIWAHVAIPILSGHAPPAP